MLLIHGLVFILTLLSWWDIAQQVLLLWLSLWVCQVIISVSLLIWNACICFQVQSYDPDTNSWLLRATIPIAKRCITAVSLNNLIYVAGGLTKAIYCYDPVEDYWMHVQNTFSRQVINTKRLVDIWNVLFFFFFYVSILAWNECTLV